jgi:nitroreductase
MSEYADTMRGMEFQDVVRRRRMVRQFAPDEVPQHSIARILANAVRGPSAGFSQGQAFLVLTATTYRSSGRWAARLLSQHVAALRC